MALSGADKALIQRFNERVSKDPLLKTSLAHFDGLEWESVGGGVERDAGCQVLRVEPDKISTRNTNGFAGGLRLQF